MTELKLKESELETLDFAMEVYGDGNGAIDAMDLGSVVRALNCNPSLETLEKLSGTRTRGEKKLKADEVVPIILELKKQVTSEGDYHDFVECLTLYDKTDDGHVLYSELHNMLLGLGEKLTEDQVDELFTDCLGDENDEGGVEYAPFLRRMCEIDPPLKRKKK